MSGSITIESPDAITADPAKTTAEPAAIIEHSEHEPDDAAAALADARRAVQEREARLAAERRAQTAEHQVAQSRVAMVASEQQAAKAAVDSAKNKLRAARESGDFDAEMAAMEELSGANYRLNSANAELAQWQQRTQQPASGGGGDGDNRTPASRAWIEAHADSWGNASFRDSMVAYHGSLVASGVRPDTAAYFQARDAEAARLEGRAAPTSARYGSVEYRAMSGTGRPPASSTAAPPSRGDGRGSGAPRTVTTPIGPRTVRSASDGKRRIEIPRHHRDDYEEAARINRMPRDKYMQSRVEISQEREAGGDGGMRSGETRTYR